MMNGQDTMNRVIDISAACGLMLEAILDNEGISKSELARRAHCSASTVANFLEGKNVTVDTLCRLVMALDMSPDVMLGEALKIAQYTAP